MPGFIRYETPDTRDERGDARCVQDLKALPTEKGPAPVWCGRPARMEFSILGTPKPTRLRARRAHHTLPAFSDCGCGRPARMGSSRPHDLKSSRTQDPRTTRPQVPSPQDLKTSRPQDPRTPRPQDPKTPGPQDPNRAVSAAHDRVEDHHERRLLLGFGLLDDREATGVVELLVQPICGVG